MKQLQLFSFALLLWAIAIRPTAAIAADLICSTPTTIGTPGDYATVVVRNHCVLTVNAALTIGHYLSIEPGGRVDIETGTVTIEASSCYDGNVCTTDRRVGWIGCEHVPNVLPCDDGNACTLTDTCQSGTCTGHTPVVCAARDQCHDAGTCNPSSGACSNPAKPNGTACDDGIHCTVGDTCFAGACSAGSPTTCADDGDVCTAEYCDLANDCVSAVTNLDSSGFSVSRIDGRDLVVLARAWNSCPNDPNFDPSANLDRDQCVDLDDFHLFMTAFGRTCP